MKFLTNLDLSQNEIQNAVIQPLAAAPANPKLGQIYYNSSDSLLYQYDGAQWKPVGKGYELPAATKTALGGIKVGGRLSVAADGTLSADKQTDNNLTAALKANYDAAYQHSQAQHAPADAEKNVQSDWNVTARRATPSSRTSPRSLRRRLTWAQFPPARRAQPAAWQSWIAPAMFLPISSRAMWTTSSTPTS